MKLAMSMYYGGLHRIVQPVEFSSYYNYASEIAADTNAIITYYPHRFADHTVLEIDRIMNSMSYYSYEIFYLIDEERRCRFAYKRFEQRGKAFGSAVEKQVVRDDLIKTFKEFNSDGISSDIEWDFDHTNNTGNIESPTELKKEELERVVLYVKALRTAKRFGGTIYSEARFPQDGDANAFIIAMGSDLSKLNSDDLVFGETANDADNHVKKEAERQNPF